MSIVPLSSCCDTCSTLFHEDSVLREAASPQQTPDATTKKRKMNSAPRVAAPPLSPTKLRRRDDLASLLVRPLPDDSSDDERPLVDCFPSSDSSSVFSGGSNYSDAPSVPSDDDAQSIVPDNDAQSHLPDDDDKVFVKHPRKTRPPGPQRDIARRRLEEWRGTIWKTELSGHSMTRRGFMPDKVVERLAMYVEWTEGGIVDEWPVGLPWAPRILEELQEVEMAWKAKLESAAAAKAKAERIAKLKAVILHGERVKKAKEKAEKGKAKAKGRERDGLAAPGPPPTPIPIPQRNPDLHLPPRTPAPFPVVPWTDTRRYDWGTTPSSGSIPPPPNLTPRPYTISATALSALDQYNASPAIHMSSSSSTSLQKSPKRARRHNTENRTPSATSPLPRFQSMSSFSSK